MADATDLFKAMNTSALIDAAKYGGYSPIDMNTLTTPKKGPGFGGLLDILLPMYAAATNAPAAKMGMAGRQAWNLHQYNKQSQQQALYALRKEQEKEAGIRGDRVAGVKSVTGGIDGYQGYEALPDNIINKRRATLQAPNNNKFLGGKALEQNQYGDIDSSVMNNYADQMGAVANFQNGRAAGLGAIADGQNQSLIRNALMKMSGGPIGGPALQQGVMDDGNGNVTLNLGASKTGAPQYIQDGMSPFLMPTDVPTGLAGLMKGGLDDAQAKGTLDETKEHNRATEAQNKRELEERIKHGYWSPNSPPAPRAFSLNEAMWANASPEQRQQWIQTTTAGSSQPTVDQQGEQLNKNLDQAVKVYGAGSNEAKAAYQAIQNHQMINPGSAAAGLLSNPIDQIRNTSPFGGSSQSKLKQSTESLSRSIYPGKGSESKPSASNRGAKSGFTFDPGMAASGLLSSPLNQIRGSSQSGRGRNK